MDDQLTITTKQGSPKYVVQDGEVQPHPEHTHVWRGRGKKAVCRICKKSKSQIQQESYVD